MNIIVNDAENTISERVEQAANYEGIKILYWSDKENVASSLKR